MEISKVQCDYGKYMLVVIGDGLWYQCREATNLMLLRMLDSFSKPKNNHSENFLGSSYSNDILLHGLLLVFTNLSLHREYRIPLVSLITNSHYVKELDPQCMVNSGPSCSRSNPSMALTINFVAWDIRPGYRTNEYVHIHQCNRASICPFIICWSSLFIIC